MDARPTFEGRKNICDMDISWVHSTAVCSEHVIFIRICAFWRLKTRKIFWPRRGVRLKAGAAKFPDTTWFSDPYSDFESVHW